jgi:septum formation protein
MNSSDLILASSSPRRQAFFRALGISFRVVTADVDESPLAAETPEAMVARLAQAKGAAVAARLQDVSHGAAQAGPLIVAADTVVALDGAILGKPADAQEARAMLQQLRGRDHQVHSAVALRRAGDTTARVRINTTTVTMRDYSAQELDAYVASGDPLDKAGAYALQHPEFAPAAALCGCAASVVGLPLADLVALLAEFGVRVEPPLAQICEAHVAFLCCTRTN